MNPQLNRRTPMHMTRLAFALAISLPLALHAQDMPGMSHDDMADDMAPMHAMQGALGAYPMTREASGTAWQPDSTPMDGVMEHHGEWMTMLHGQLSLIHDHQGGSRGDTQTFSTSMLMGMAQRPLAGGTLALHGMVSLDPVMGKRGYPLLLATGETADGTHELVDRQHPHDAVMELSASWSHSLGADASGFVYLGLPGEPALGPTTFMHRASGAANPEAPIAHHWLDSTHVTFGVATAGVTYRNFKLEGSRFNGREPDQHRWNIEQPRLDSWSLRASWNPNANWSLQVSQGLLHSPEQLHPETNVRRTTASATWNRPLDNGNWQTTLAWGRNSPRGVHVHDTSTDAWLLESALQRGRWTGFTRAEHVDKGELFGDGQDGNPLADRVFAVGKLSVGGYRTWLAGHFDVDLGALVSGYALPSALHAAYGAHPASFMLFTRVRIAR